MSADDGAPRPAAISGASSEAEDEVRQAELEALTRIRAGAEVRPRRAKKRRRTAGAGRDPVTLGETVEDVMAGNGWQHDLAVAAVVARWPQVVGADIAEHCQVEGFSDETLVVRADSTAWATQIRLLSAQLLARLADEAGNEVVREVKILGPGTPSWRHGTRSVPGRGPRDTYG